MKKWSYELFLFIYLSSFYLSFFLFFYFFSKKKRKLSSYGYTEPTFKLAKYQHLELILRENKLTYTKLISNEADSGTKIESERGKEKKKRNTISCRPTYFGEGQCLKL